MEKRTTLMHCINAEKGEETLRHYYAYSFLALAPEHWTQNIASCQPRRPLQHE